MSGLLELLAVRNVEDDDDNEVLDVDGHREG